MKWALSIVSHLVVGGVGFALGIYALPILTQPASPSMQAVESVTNQALFTGAFQRDRQDSDFLHWGEGSLSISDSHIAFVGELAPGPDYKLYLSPKFIETEADFNANKAAMVQIGDVKTFDRFSLSIPEQIDIANYNTAIVWCETFGEFITSARFK
ncbi:phenylalanyl-tRNA synthetase beta subunit [Vibrio sinaloensis DSM 21326]|uniref:Phenylalanyl-tRNA synthetase beta subunit n=1 Tax=Vibrio sinaloensis DSM 21326 TaxID=945550 RepID=E8MAZ4_PHOS4|nr:DM13 domain-containing protein [Vibrio sinaloensis]EGA68824.1 phenylalanyl-tRNA synthetase beta subunit [Vibrio sinaloensis DSM 21326]